MTINIEALMGLNFPEVQVPLAEGACDEANGNGFAAVLGTLNAAPQSPLSLPDQPEPNAEHAPQAEQQVEAPKDIFKETLPVTTALIMNQFTEEKVATANSRSPLIGNKLGLGDGVNQAMLHKLSPQVKVQDTRVNPEIEAPIKTNVISFVSGKSLPHDSQIDSETVNRPAESQAESRTVEVAVSEKPVEGIIPADVPVEVAKQPVLINEQPQILPLAVNTNKVDPVLPEKEMEQIIKTPVLPLQSTIITTEKVTEEVEPLVQEAVTSSLKDIPNQVKVGEDVYGVKHKEFLNEKPKQSVDAPLKFETETAQPFKDDLIKRESPKAPAVLGTPLTVKEAITDAPKAEFILKPVLGQAHEEKNPSLKTAETVSIESGNKPQITGHQTMTSALKEAGFQVKVPDHSPAPQLMGELRASLQTGKDRMHIRFDPPELGKFSVKLDFSTEGNVRAVILVDKPETFDLLSRNPEGMRQALESAGLKSDMQFDLREQNAGVQKDPLGSNQSGHSNDSQDRKSSSQGRREVREEVMTLDVVLEDETSSEVSAMGRYDIRV